MKTGPCFPEARLAQLQAVCAREPRVAALYIFDLEHGDECNVAVLFTKTPTWPERLELELAVAKALGVEGVEIIDLRRMPLVSRYDVIHRGQSLYVGQPDTLAVFIEETLFHYMAYYPLLEALYWKVETKPLSPEMLES